MSPDDLVVRIEARLAELEGEQSRLKSELRALRPTLGPGDRSWQPMVTARSSATEKMQFFRRLFAGRPDVVARRWENPKTGKSGYAPACANEWVKGICAKPHVKCGECSNQAFVPLSDALLMKHLRGGDGRADDVVIGVYPLLADDRCWFVAADSLFTPEDITRINSEIALIAEHNARFIAEDDSGASYNYGDEGFPKRPRKLRAAEWLGVTPQPENA